MIGIFSFTFHIRLELGGTAVEVEIQRDSSPGSTLSFSMLKFIRRTLLLVLSLEDWIAGSDDSIYVEQSPGITLFL